MEVSVPVQTQARVKAMVADLGSQAAVASALGVHRSRVTRWLADEAPDPSNLRKVEAFEFVLARLLAVYDRGTALKWLMGFNAHLGDRRPVDMLAQGRVSQVIAAIEAADAGSYA